MAEADETQSLSNEITALLASKRSDVAVAALVTATIAVGKDLSKKRADFALIVARLIHDLWDGVKLNGKG